jgi:predicted RecB family endonuclease
MNALRSADVVQLGFLDVVNEGARQLAEQGVVEVVALVDQVLVEFLQGVLGKVVGDADRALLVLRFDVDRFDVPQVVRRLGHLPGRELGKLDFPFLSEVSRVHDPSCCPVTAPWSA